MTTLRYKVEISSLKEEGKGMIFLDANAFYSYMGRKNVGLGESAHVKEKELRGYLDSIFDTHISLNHYHSYDICNSSPHHLHNNREYY